MMKNIFLMSFLSLQGAWCFAEGHEIGNGGDVVVCYADQTRQRITSFQLYDHWESLHLIPNAEPINLGASSLSVKEKIQIELNRIDKIDSSLAESIKKYSDTISNHIEDYLVTGAELPEIDDTNPRIIPSSNCFIEQFAVQWRNVITGQKRFMIAAKFYNHPLMSNTDRAGLILHEAIYRHAILNFKPKDSRGVRLLNYAFATQLSETMNLQAYAKLLEHADFEQKGCKIEFNKTLNDYVYASWSKDAMFMSFCSNYEKVFGNLKAVFSPKSVLSVTDGGMNHYASLLDVYYLNNREWKPLGMSIQGKLSANIRLWGNRTGFTLTMNNLAYPNPQSMGSHPFPFIVDVSGTKFTCKTDFARNEFSRNFYYDMKGNLMGCKELVRPVDFLINSRKVSVAGEIMTTDHIRLKSFRLGAPAQLQLNGTRIFKEFEGQVTLNDAGMLTQGTLKNATITLEGKKFELGEVSIADDGQVTANVRLAFLHPKINGHRVLAFSESSSDPFKNRTRMCELLNLGSSILTVYSVGVHEFESAFITGSETFYDLAKNNTSYKSDEEVRYVAGIACFNHLKFRF